MKKGMCTVTYKDKNFKIPLVKCGKCKHLYHNSCRDCIKKSWEEACTKAGCAFMLGGEYIDPKNMQV